MVSARIDGYNTVVDLTPEPENEGGHGDTIEYVVDSEGSIQTNADVAAIYDQLQGYLAEGTVPVVAIFVPNR